MMDAAAIGVMIGSVLLIVFVLWYFFGKREAVAAQADESGVQEVNITVKGGYEPDLIVVKQGKPVRLDFYRAETAACSEQVIFGDFGIAKARLLREHTMKNIRQNLFFAFIYNFIGVPIAAGILFPWFGVVLSQMIASAAMALSSVSVISNALRLRSKTL
jgi:hypothetical protein